MKKILMCAVLATSAISAHADVKYTTEMSMMQNGKLTPFSSMTTWRKAGLQRVDSQQTIGKYRSSESTVTRCAKSEQVVFDPRLKIYAVEQLKNGKVVGSGAGATGSTGTPGTGKIIMTSTVKFIGRVKLAGRLTRHYRISQRMQSSGCSGTFDTSSKSEIWVADVALPAFNCGPSANDWTQGYSSGNCKITFVQRGDTKALAAAYKGLVMKNITFDASGKVSSQMQIKAISFANLDAKSFNAPANFKKQSRADYDKSRQEAMIAGMSG